MSRYGSLADAPVSLRLRGARVVDPSRGLDEVGDLAIHDGLLVDPRELPAGYLDVDASGLVAAPAFCDLHAHLRQPGQQAGETIESGARAAAHGGYSTVCAMPNTEPALDEPARVAYVLHLARDAACRVRVVAAATVGRQGEKLPELAELLALGIAGVSDDGASVPTARVTRSLLAYLAPLDLPLIEHAEEAGLAEGTVMRAGPIANRLGLAGWPASAELTIVERDIALAAETGARVHFTHLSTAGAVAAVRRAKLRGLPVTCDVTPHHMAMTDAWVAGDRSFSWEVPEGAPGDAYGGSLDERLAYDGACRVNPPLSTRADALALLAGMRDGTVDAIATDHAPHPPERKDVEFTDAAPGMIALETALSLGLAAVRAGCLDLSTLIGALSTGPAAIIGEARSLASGSPADVTLFDADAWWRVERDALASASWNTPLLGRDLPGVVRLTLANGRVTYVDGLPPIA